MLSCQLYQRSADIALGVPFNIASYALLTHMIANHCNLKVGDFIHTIGDAHIYENHIEGVKLQLQRTPRNLPQLQMPVIESFNINYIRTLKVSDFRLIDYDPMESIKFDMAV
jgi:thymidylate synthase